MEQRQHKQKVLGCILGQPIGDACGWPREFNKSMAVSDLPRHNQFTDDSQMMSAIGEALLDSPPHLGEEKFMAALSRSFVNWQANPLGGSHRSPGGACSNGCANLRHSNGDWKTSGGSSAKGNGSAMRSSVVGAYYWQKPTYAYRIGCMTSIPTHNNLEALIGAGSVSYIVACSIKGYSFAKTIGNLLQLIRDWGTHTPSRYTRTEIGTGYEEVNPWYIASMFGMAYTYGRSGMPWAEYRQIVDGNGLSTFAVIPAVSSAIFANAQHSNYKEIVLGLVNNTGDCDTTAAIGGGIAGARFGYGFISKDWRDRIELSDYWHELAERVWQSSLTVDIKADTVAANSRI